MDFNKVFDSSTSKALDGKSGDLYCADGIVVAEVI